ncbi:ATP11-domain-containing protein [Laetiporus sulphureus 93-53]|uniref:ATP11-domain-containing protein n=1 Tax=Laetiporus sulphureus 93-53 TaxID=1314785 RepID=A0A165E4T5_9APHY|nr:ATP11-domain-containing protein [Laetiporus sulphureus 93-53]KZT06241.1 ATP11-domain-containing protein [Laetiporus sulphureus 93-53]
MRYLARLSLISSAIRQPVRRCQFCSTARQLQGLHYESKYAEKLQKRAQERGMTFDELREELREQERERRRQRDLEAEQAAKALKADSASFSESAKLLRAGVSERKDSSPVKPLNSILNLDRLISTPHTPDQISVLWRAYHDSRSGGTGRGFLSASIPVDTYEKMMSVARRYPAFLVPLPRPGGHTDEQKDNKSAHEFYFMQWGFHGSPPEPSRDLFAPRQPSSNPQTSTILFTPLQEYKLRNSFATPYLILTHYTDLARSHGLVLLRGEITPSAHARAADGSEGSYLLSQQDAQLLAIAVQNFYLWSEGKNERTALLESFHDNPTEFKWEELLKHSDYAL